MSTRPSPSSLGRQTFVENAFHYAFSYAVSYGVSYAVIYAISYAVSNYAGRASYDVSSAFGYAVRAMLPVGSK